MLYEGYIFKNSIKRPRCIGQRDSDSQPRTSHEQQLTFQTERAILFEIRTLVITVTDPTWSREDREKAFDAKVKSLRAALSNWYDEESSAIDAGIVSSAPAGTGGSIAGIGPAIDSKRVLDASAITRRVLGIDIPPEIIKRGGYNSKNELFEDLLPQLRSVYSGERKVKQRSQSKQMTAVQG